MDYGRFDALTRSVSEGGTRRAIFRLLAGGALSGVAARLGLAEVTEAKAKNRQAKPKRTSQAERKTQETVSAEGNGKKRKGKKKPKPNPCGPNRRFCPRDGSCIATNACCPDRKFCPGEGCIPHDECCALTAPLCDECQEEFCDKGAWTCRSTTSLSACQQCPAGSVFCNAQLGKPGWDWFDLPPGCCPLDRYVWDEPSAGYWCKQPDGPGAVLMLCD